MIMVTIMTMGGGGGGGVGAEFLGEFYQFLTSALMQSLIMLQARSENGYGF